MNGSAHVAHVRLQGAPVDYRLLEGGQAVVPMFVTGVQSVDEFAGAKQFDIKGIVTVADFGDAFPARAEGPRRFDRVTVGGQTYTVEEARAAPITSPVLYRVLLRGGQQ